MDRALVTVKGPPGGLASLALQQTGPLLSVAFRCPDPDLRPCLACFVSIPCMHNVQLAAEGPACLEVRDMVESDYCRLAAEDGLVTVNGVKTEELSVTTRDGAVWCQGAVQGRVRIRTVGGSVTGDRRFLGPELDITTERGDITVASCYSDTSRFTTQTGDIDLRNLHNESNVTVQQEGRVTVRGLDGSTDMFAKRGSMDLQVSRVRFDSRVHLEQGDILLKLTATHPLNLAITATEIVLDPAFQQLSTVEVKADGYSHYSGTVQPEQAGPRLEVVARAGRVEVVAQSWAESLGLGRMAAADTRNRRGGEILPQKNWSMEDILKRTD
jgi:hypothetical protein